MRNGKLLRNTGADFRPCGRTYTNHIYYIYNNIILVLLLTEKTHGNLRCVLKRRKRA